MIAVFAFSRIAVADDSVLEVGNPIARELSDVQEHNYHISLEEGQYASVMVEQRGIDVVVQLFGPDDRSIADFDSENRIQGEEEVGIMAESASSYRLLVKAKYPRLPAGNYEIRLIEVRNATEQDRWVDEAHRQETASRKIWATGKYDEALPAAEKAIELLERRWGTEHPDLIYPLLNIAAIYYYKGDFTRAQRLCERALTIAEKTLGPEHPRVARVLHNLAIFYSPGEAGDERAEVLNERALAIQEKALGPDHPLVASSQSELAVLYRKKGDFVRAEPLLQRAAMVQEKALGEEHVSFAATLGDLAGLYREMGDYAKAEPLYLRALAIYEKANHPYVAPCLNDLADLYRDVGQYDKAEPLYQRSISIKEKSVGPDHADVADTRANIAFLYYARGNYAKAETLYLSALATLEKALGPDHPTVGFHLSYLADVYFATHDFAKAEPLYHRALSILEAANGPNYYHLADILVSLAKMSAAQDKIAQAVAYQERANDIIEHNLDINLTIGSERQKLAYLASLPEQMNQAIALQVRFAGDDPTARELSATAILQRKGRVQDALSNNLASLRRRFSPEDQSLSDQWNVTTSKLSRLVLNGPEDRTPSEYQKRIKALEEERETLESKISSRNPEFSVQLQPVTLAAVRSAIPDNAALIELVVYRPFDAEVESNKAESGELRYVAYIIRRQGEIQWKELGDAKAIDGAIDQMREALRDPKRKDVQQLARAVDQKIMQPIRPLLGDATQLFVSPDGPLNLIPFEALVDEQNHYLVERFSITYLTSGRDLLRMQAPRESKSNSVVFANPMFGEPELMAQANVPKSQRVPIDRRAHGAGKRQSVTTGSDLSDVYFAPLGGTAQEAQAIKSLFAEASVLTGTQATESSLKGVSAPRILHIATHGFFLTDTPASSSTAITEGTRSMNANVKIDNPLLRSGLALAGANLHKGNDDDGILTALEASGLNLWGTKLVTLSACDTGLGEVKNGEGVYGLRRAFVLAGTETLVMSLWPVSDYVTREMMTNYYKGLKQGLGRGEALRQVQLSMLKRKGREHPFYWAGFIQSGEWANLDGKR